jgi:Cu-Zn family superoxide dismutase
MRRALIVAGLVLIGAAVADGEEPMKATAQMKDAQGQPVGTVLLEQTPHGVLVTADLTNLPAGVHAIHIHEVGKCEPPFKTAGAHFNPEHHKHGIMEKSGMHAGDMPNLSVDEAGKAKAQFFITGITLGKGKTSVFDADGSAVIVHAQADDYKTDPAGAAGDRIACGVIEKAK